MQQVNIMRSIESVRRPISTVNFTAHIMMMFMMMDRSARWFSAKRVKIDSSNYQQIMMDEARLIAAN